MPRISAAIAVIGIDIGTNSFHVVGLILRQKWSRGQIEGRLANMPPCLVSMEAFVGAHHLSHPGSPKLMVSAPAAATVTTTPIASRSTVGSLLMPC